VTMRAVEHRREQRGWGGRRGRPEGSDAGAAPEADEVRVRAKQPQIRARREDEDRPLERVAQSSLVLSRLP
jgi:hypothetical protein